MAEPRDPSATSASVRGAANATSGETESPPRTPIPGTPSEADAELPFDPVAVATADRRGTLRRTAERLRRVGLAPRALHEVCGLRAVHRPAIESLEWPAVLTEPHAAWVWCLVAGRPVSAATLCAGSSEARRLLSDLLALGWCRREGGAIVPRVAILPIEDRFVLCEPVATPPNRDLVAAPDLSAYHLIDQIRDRRPASWLDVATGTGVVGLAGRRSGGGLLVGCDRNRRALAFAEVGARLSGCRDVSWYEGDLFDALEPGRRFDLVTFNPPLVELDDDDAGGELPLYMAGAAGLRARFWEEVPGRVLPGASVVVHSALAADEPELPAAIGLPGALDVHVFRLGPCDRFAITVWRPDGVRRVTWHEIPDGEAPRVGGS